MSDKCEEMKLLMICRLEPTSCSNTLKSWQLQHTTLQASLPHETLTLLWMLSQRWTPLSWYQIHHNDYCLFIHPNTTSSNNKQSTLHGNDTNMLLQPRLNKARKQLYCFKHVIITYRPKNRGHFVLQPITLEILNRSLPYLAQITVSSFWTSCHNLFESTFENSAAIWRITLTVNKMW